MGEIPVSIIISVGENVLRLLDRTGIPYEVIWRPGEEKIVKAILPVPGKRTYQFGRGGFLKIGKCPPRGDESSGAVSARLVEKYLRENGIVQIDRTKMVHELNKIRNVVNCNYGVLEALKQGWLVVVK